MTRIYKGEETIKNKIVYYNNSIIYNNIFLLCVHILKNHLKGDSWGPFDVNTVTLLKEASPECLTFEGLFLNQTGNLILFEF